MKIYDLNEIAEILGVTKRTVYNYIKAKKLPASKIGKEWRVTPEQLQKFLDDNSNIQ